MKEEGRLKVRHKTGREKEKMRDAGGDGEWMKERDGGRNERGKG